MTFVKGYVMICVTGPKEEVFSVKRKITIFWVVWSFLFLSYSVVFATITMKSVVDREEITLDDNVKLVVTINIENENMNRVRIGQVNFPATDDFEVVGKSSSSRFSSINGRVARSFQTIFSLMPTKAGKLMIPPIKDFYLDRKGIRHQLETPPIDILVREVKSEEEKEESRSSKKLTPPPLVPKSPTSFLFKVMVSTVIFISLITVGLFYFFKRKTPEHSTVVENRDTFDLKVEKNIVAERIKEKEKETGSNGEEFIFTSDNLRLIGRRDEKEFVREISRLLRGILERRSETTFSDKTGSEILDRLSILKLGGEGEEIVRDLLERVEMVSYCGATISFDEMEEMIDKLRRLEKLIG